MQTTKAILTRVERALTTVRFEDEAHYVPYFWWTRRRRPRTKIGDIWMLTVSVADVELFPDLAGVSVVALRETDGHVHETSAEDALRDWMRGR